MRDALLFASRTAANIRATQTMQDGNHRNALLSFVFALAETSVTIRPTFAIYRAYLILSARYHPGNVGNMLDSETSEEVALQLFRYARRRVRPGTPTLAYLSEWAETIRQLPIYVSRVEVEYRRIRDLTGDSYQAKLAKLQKLKKQKEALKMLDTALHRDIVMGAEPSFRPGHNDTQ